MKTAAPLSERLLDAQVQFFLHQFEGEALEAFVTREVDAALAVAEQLSLESCVTRKAVKGSALAFAAEFELGGGLPELVGEIARSLHGHPVHAHTRLGDLVSDRVFADFLDKILELQPLRERLVRAVVASPLYAEFATDLLYEGLRGYVADSAVTRAIPGAQSAMKLGKSLLAKATPKLEASLEDNVRRYVGRSVAGVSQRSAESLLLRLDNKRLRAMALDVWRQVKPLKLSSLMQDLDALDVEELFVAGYEYWRDLRKTPYYSALIEAGIDAFFDRYGKESLGELLEDLGIGREAMIAEGLRYAPNALKALRKKKLLEPMIRRQLEPFYRSEAFARIVGE